jgi:hypothetical protein
MRTAQETIGDQAPDDYILRPEVHADQLPKEAGALARVLRSDEINGIVQKYRAADRRALQFQGIYKRFGRVAIGLQAFGTVVGALFIIVTFGESAGNNLNMVELAAVLIAVMAGGLASAANSFNKWNEARANAEVARVEFFQRVVSASAKESPGELPILPLQLEYFRRYQLQIQEAYYRTRGAAHLSAHRVQQGLAVGLALFALSLLVVSADNAFDFYPYIREFEFAQWFGDNRNNVFAGLVIATLSAAIGNWSLLSQNENNAKRYAATYANLEKIESDYLESAREAAETGNKEGVLSFVDSVNDLVSLEHRQWVYLQEVAAHPDIGPFGIIRVPKLRRRSQTKG